MINKKYERLKKYIKEKYGQKCYFCKNSNINSLQVRHIIPKRLGGADLEENLILCCDECKKYIPTLITNNDPSYKQLPKEMLGKIEIYCKAKFQKEKMVPLKTFIPYNLYKKLIEIKKETSTPILMEVFEDASEPTKYATYKVEFKCKNCGKSIYKIISKSELKNWINSECEYICPNCEPKPKEEDTRTPEEKEEAKTLFFINMLCNPNMSWEKDKIKPSETYNQLWSYYFGANKFKIANYLQKLPYKQFLSTPYWTAIAAKKKIKAHYCCKVCNSQKLLNVHHKTYEHHGCELDNMNDLIVLCSDCHKKFHNIIKED